MNNDERIMALKCQIEAKKKLLNSKNKRFVPITNCMLELDGVKYNLHTQSSPLLLTKLYNLRVAAEELKKKYPQIDFGNVQICGYSIDDWLSDVVAVLEVQNYKSEKSKLDRLEKELTNLLSDDKQTELKINELESLLNI